LTRTKKSLTAKQTTILKIVRVTRVRGDWLIRLESHRHREYCFGDAMGLAIFLLDICERGHLKLEEVRRVVPKPVSAKMGVVKILGVETNSLFQNLPEKIPGILWEGSNKYGIMRYFSPGKGGALVFWGDVGFYLWWFDSGRGIERPVSEEHIEFLLGTGRYRYFLGEGMDPKREIKVTPAPKRVRKAWERASVLLDCGS